MLYFLTPNAHLDIGIGTTVPRNHCSLEFYDRLGYKTHNKEVTNTTPPATRNLIAQGIQWHGDLAGMAEGILKMSCVDSEFSR